MLSLLEQSRKVFAGVLGKPLAAAVPASDQTRHGFGRRFDPPANGARTQCFQRLPHHLRLGAAGLTRYPFN
jgi:hypothetical protein